MAPKVEKVSVAIALEDLEWARARAEREESSLSSVLTALVRAARLREDKVARQRASFASYVAWATKGNPITAEEREAAERELDELGL